MFYVLLLQRILLTPPVASTIPIFDDKPLFYRSKCCKSGASRLATKLRVSRDAKAF
jgi:hypothetical protein